MSGMMLTPATLVLTWWKTTSPCSTASGSVWGPSCSKVRSRYGFPEHFFITFNPSLTLIHQKKKKKHLPLSKKEKKIADSYRVFHSFYAIFFFFFFFLEKKITPFLSFCLSSTKPVCHEQVKLSLPWQKMILSLWPWGRCQTPVTLFLGGRREMVVPAVMFFFVFFLFLYKLWLGTARDLAFMSRPRGCGVDQSQRDRLEGLFTTVGCALGWSLEILTPFMCRSTTTTTAAVI